MIAVSFSGLARYRRCPRRYQYEKVDKRQPLSKSHALKFGSAVDKLLEIQDDEGCTAALDAVDVVGSANELEGHDKGTMMVLLAGYKARWSGEKPWEILSHQEAFEMDLVNPRSGKPSRTFFVRGFMDAVVRVDGNLHVVERKTSGEDISPGSAYWDRLTMNEQVSLYWKAGLGLGDLRSVIYDVIGKPSIKPAKATPEDKRRYTKGKPCKPCKGTGREQSGIAGPCEACEGSKYKEAPRLDKRQRTEDETPAQWTERLGKHAQDNPERYFQRSQVVRMDNEIERAEQDIWDLTQLLRRSYAEELFPRNPDACMLYNTKCPFWDVCTGTATLDDDSRFMDRQTAKEATDGTAY